MAVLDELFKVLCSYWINFVEYLVLFPLIYGKLIVLCFFARFSQDKLWYLDQMFRVLSLVRELVQLLALSGALLFFWLDINSTSIQFPFPDYWCSQ